MNPRRIVIFVAVVVGVLALDQGSKAWARGLPEGVPQSVVDGFWDWEYAQNTGVAFFEAAAPAAPACREHAQRSALPASQTRCGNAASPLPQGFSTMLLRVVLSLLAAGAVAALAYAAFRTRPDQRMRRVAFALCAGGALGNLVDRVRLGAVTDFVRWRIHDHRWPIFNIADAALLVGVALILLDGTRRAARVPRATPQP